MKALMLLILLSGDVERNPGPDIMGELTRERERKRDRLPTNTATKLIEQLQTLISVYPDVIIDINVQFYNSNMRVSHYFHNCRFPANIT